MTNIVYPALVVLALALLMVLLTELYIRRQERQSQRHFHKLNEAELKRVEQELLMKKWKRNNLYKINKKIKSLSNEEKKCFCQGRNEPLYYTHTKQTFEQ